MIEKQTAAVRPEGPSPIGITENRLNFFTIVPLIALQATNFKRSADLETCI